MTSQLMPFAATVLPQANANAMQILESHRNWPSAGASTILAIPAGVSQIVGTYNGPQAMAINLRLQDGTRTEIARIEAGSGFRSSQIVTLPAISAGEGLQIFLGSNATAHDAATYRASVTVIPTPHPNTSF